MLAGLLSGSSCSDASLTVLGSTCCLEGPLLPSWDAMNVAVAPCLTESSRPHLWRNKGIYTLDAFLLETVPKHVHRCGGGEVLGKLGQVFHVLFVCPIPQVDFSSYWLLACRKNTGVHKHNIVIAYARHWNTSVYKRWPVCAEDIQGIVCPCGKLYYLFASNVIEGVWEKLVDGGRLVMPSDRICFPVYIREVCISRGYGPWILKVGHLVHYTVLGSSPDYYQWVCTSYQQLWVSLSPCRWRKLPQFLR